MFGLLFMPDAYLVACSPTALTLEGERMAFEIRSQHIVFQEAMFHSSLYFLSQEHEKEVKGNARYESSDGIYHIVGLDVHRGQTKKHIEGNQ